MSIKNLLKVALTAIMSNKFRSFLSMLGIIIGVAAVIIMMAIGQGGRLTLNQFENLRNISGAIVQYGKVDNAATTTNSEVIPLVSVGIDFERWSTFAMQR